MLEVCCWLGVGLVCVVCGLLIVGWCLFVV